MHSSNMVARIIISMVEHDVTGADYCIIINHCIDTNYCTGANYYKALI